MSGDAPWWAWMLMATGAGSFGIGLAMWQDRRDRKPRKPLPWRRIGSVAYDTFLLGGAGFTGALGVQHFLADAEGSAAAVSFICSAVLWIKWAWRRLDSHPTPAIVREEPAKIETGVVPRAHGWAAAIEHSEAAMRAISTAPPPRVETRPGYEGGPAADSVWGWSAAARDAEVADRARPGGYITGGYIKAGAITAANGRRLGPSSLSQLSGPGDTPAVVGKDVTTLSDVDLCAQEGHLLHWGGDVCLRCDRRVT